MRYGKGSYELCAYDVGRAAPAYLERYTAATSNETTPDAPYLRISGLNLSNSNIER